MLMIKINLQDLGVGLAPTGVTNEVLGIDSADFPDDGRNRGLKVVTFHQSHDQLRQRGERRLVMGENLRLNK